MRIATVAVYYNIGAGGISLFWCPPYNHLLGIKMSDQKIKEAIDEYAAAYKKLQLLQETLPAIPQGDQKTGCIGEYYSFKYLQFTHPNAHLSYGSHSEKGWDISIKHEDAKTRIQVKTVSAYSKTRTISPIHRGWDVLHLIYLNKALRPEGFWVINDTSIFGGEKVLKSKKCRNPGNPNQTGSESIPFGENRIEELLESINA